MTKNEIGTIIIAAAIDVHRELGPGLLESVYEVVLARELSDRGLTVERQVQVPSVYKDMHFAEAFRSAGGSLLLGSLTFPRQKRDPINLR